MMNRSLIIIIIVAIHCIKLHDFLNTMGEKIDSQSYINGNVRSLNSQQKSPYDCDTPPENYTAGRTMCRSNDVCGFGEGTTYSWCFVDYFHDWDYCCTGPCDYAGWSYLWCQSGSSWQYCGNCLTKDVQGRPCLDTFPCGLHLEDIDEIGRFYWCYVDLEQNWDYCCAPHSKCKKYDDKTGWCYVGGDKQNDMWTYCVLE
ncbi:hypothetical protein CHS0354_015073 [Potamilus streckersoni]|uniref:Uncharacterized protein n=1 Tax=Potamilus streckersoni TaxID=2493646 RepID=A0AAE0TGL8_9BIVA|nr:hypothetical protein CHS0354_015073 [Potamilus streckersoni]